MCPGIFFCCPSDVVAGSCCCCRVSGDCVSVGCMCIVFCFAVCCPSVAVRMRHLQVMFLVQLLPLPIPSISVAFTSTSLSFPCAPYLFVVQHVHVCWFVCCLCEVCVPRDVLSSLHSTQPPLSPLK
ncbi:hypothetical protein I3842_09G134100 [Carya illinoinensis]|uniref:Uncharacterized protein n=1 Tax=Carya illinoinensis TaxID=32201 RepID=A0A922E4V7_CARIL|nr:hypothetical protein I3842_09G134100 [Carya illinoinensis]